MIETKSVKKLNKKENLEILSDEEETGNRKDFPKKKKSVVFK